MRKLILGFMACVVLVGSMANSDCTTPATSAGGVEQLKTQVPKGSDGLTVEQRNVRDRLAIDNKPGSIKHLYIISAYSGQVLLYSTVTGKVTSSGKRLQPSMANRDGSGAFNTAWDMVYTNEVLGDDGTYGGSVEYLFWWDTRGVYHQQYVTGGMILHISDQPVAVKGVVINLSMEPDGK